MRRTISDRDGRFVRRTNHEEGPANGQANADWDEKAGRSSDTTGVSTTMRRAVSHMDGIRDVRSVMSSDAGQANDDWDITTPAPHRRSFASLNIAHSATHINMVRTLFSTNNTAQRRDSANLAHFPGQSLKRFLTRQDDGNRSLTSGASSVDFQALAKKRRDRKSFLRKNRIFDNPATVAGYASVPLIPIDRLPRGGLSLETSAIGRVQFGIPPETIKDSMRLGIGVPTVYIVPVERFCREVGPALGINLAEFEFPAYFSYFVRGKRCTLVVDSKEAENNIRRVFSETLLGPDEFRNHDDPTANNAEDFDASFPEARRPNFYKEFYHFRTAEASTNFKELTIDDLVDFCHFKGSKHSSDTSGSVHSNLGVPPDPPTDYVTGADQRGNKSTQKKGRRHSATLPLHLQEFGIGSGDKVHDLHEEEKPMPQSVKERVPRTKTENEMRHSMQETQEGKQFLLRKTQSFTDLKKEPVHSLKRNGLKHWEHELKNDEKTISWKRITDESSWGKTHRSVSFPDLRTLSSTSDSMYPADDQPFHVRRSRKGSMDSSVMAGRHADGISVTSGVSLIPDLEEEDENKMSPTWMYSQAKWLGDVATIYPENSTRPNGISTKTARVEVFKMTGGTEYIVHDIDENNVIAGKARFSGTCRVPNAIAVEGFTTSTGEHPLDDDASECSENSEPSLDEPFGIPPHVAPTTFHPPSFGVTVLGNSHGFDKNGSTSGYVLWINGRGVMIDPPPYSSAALEREGIRPRMIIAILITHCHADHDAGAFQKVMTGARVAVITTPTIYKSFIRKYAALSGLRPELLRHSHRHRPAVIGQPLSFQGAVFNFTYTLHTIPCIAFRVDWRGRSMVFTGDHLNSPPMIDHLEKTGVLSAERAKDLRDLPLQDCDILLHEAGTPPIHTPIQVLCDLPDKVKERLYVVHTSALPADCGLKVAPTGTAGTIRLDTFIGMPLEGRNAHNDPRSGSMLYTSGRAICNTSKITFDGSSDKMLNDLGYSFSAIRLRAEEVTEDGEVIHPRKVPPLVFLRPTSVSDAWFILHLLSAVPFLSTLSYANTMEVLELAQVDVFCAQEVVVPANQRSEALCVVWEGSCIESDPDERDSVPSYDDALPKTHTSSDTTDIGLIEVTDSQNRDEDPIVWHAGDWTSPRSLQPDPDFAAETSPSSRSKDVVATSSVGVKVITLQMKYLHPILKNGSKLYRKYLEMQENQAREANAMREMFEEDGEFSAEYKAEELEQMLLHDNVLEVIRYNSVLSKFTALQKRHFESLAEGPRFFDPGAPLWEVGRPVDFAFLIVSGSAQYIRTHRNKWQQNRRGSTGSMSDSDGSPPVDALVPGFEEDKMLFSVRPSSEYARLDAVLQLRAEQFETDEFEHPKDLTEREERLRGSRDRFANKVLARLYSRRAYTRGLVFSRGHFLSDTSRMVTGSLAFIERESTPVGPDTHVHSSHLEAGVNGCVAMVFQRSNLITFLDNYPGLLLSMLGTQVIV